MKKFYAPLVASILFGGAVQGQSRSLTGSHIPIEHREHPGQDIGIAAEPGGAPRGGGGPLWSDDFSDPSTWVTGNWPGTPAIQWQIGTGLQCTGDYPIAPIQSTTYDNGCALIDSDAFGNQSVAESSHMTTAAPIDLSGYPYVVLEFQSFYRKWTNEECYVVISTNNTDWPALDPQTDISGMPNVFHAWPGMEVQAPVNNPTTVRINISGAAGGQPQVWVRFHWTGVWGYAWFVDDVFLLEQPADDVIMNSAFISQVVTGEEYGRMPANQFGSTVQVGGAFMNFGYEAQTNVAVDMELLDPGNNVVLTASASVPNLASGQTATMDQTVNLPTLNEGLYSGVFTVTSDQEQSGDHFANNTYLRNLEVNNLRYSLDGIGNHPPGYQTLSSMGTNSFTDGSDGFMMMVYYEVSEALWVTGLEVAITSTSVPGALLYGAIHWEDDVLNDQVNSPMDQTVGHDLTAQEVASGIVTLNFDAPVQLQPGTYYAGVEMYSNGNATDVRILDDVTVPQPDLASVIYIPGDQVYTNGNAAAIRLIVDPFVSVDEHAALQGVSLFPNPTSGTLNLRSEHTGSHLIEVSDMTGRLIHTQQLNGSGTIGLEGHAAGTYLVRVSTADGALVQRITLH